MTPGKDNTLPTLFLAVLLPFLLLSSAAHAQPLPMFPALVRDSVLGRSSGDPAAAVSNFEPVLGHVHLFARSDNTSTDIFADTLPVGIGGVEVKAKQEGNDFLIESDLDGLFGTFNINLQFHEHDLPSWWPEDLDIKEVEEAIQEAAGATDGSPRALMVPPNGILKGALFQLTVHPASETEIDQQELQQSSRSGESNNEAGFTGPLGALQDAMSSTSFPFSLRDQASNGVFSNRNVLENLRERLRDPFGFAQRNGLEEGGIQSILDPIGFWSGLLDDMTPMLLEGDLLKEANGVFTSDITITPGLAPQTVQINGTQNGRNVVFEADERLMTDYGEARPGMIPNPTTLGSSPLLQLSDVLLGASSSMAATASTTLGIDLPKFVPSSVTLATLAEAIREAFGAVDGKPAKILIPPVGGPLKGALVDLTIYPKSSNGTEEVDEDEGKKDDKGKEKDEGGKKVKGKQAGGLPSNESVNREANGSSLFAGGVLKGLESIRSKRAADQEGILLGSILGKNLPRNEDDARSGLFAGGVLQGLGAAGRRLREMSDSNN